VFVFFGIGSAPNPTYTPKARSAQAGGTGGNIGVGYGERLPRLPVPAYLPPRDETSSADKRQAANRIKTILNYLALSEGFDSTPLS